MLFNLILPFIEVILHTYIDLLREEDDDDEGKTKQINHHGRAVDVPSSDKSTPIIKVTPKDLVAVNEKLQQAAMKSYYHK